MTLHDQSVPPTRPSLRSAASKNALSGFLNLAILTGRGMVVPAIVGPIGFGLWQSLMLIPTVAHFANLGRNFAMGKKTATLIGAGHANDSQELTDTKSNAFWGSAFTGLAIMLVLAIASSLVKGQHSGFYSIALPLAGILVISDLFNQYYSQLFRAELRFTLLAVTRTALPAISTALAIPFAILWGSQGLVYALVIATVITVGFQATRTPIVSLTRISLKHQIALIRPGLLLMVVPAIGLLTITADRLFIVTFLGVESMGFYSLALLIGRAVIFIPDALGNVLLPLLLNESGRTGSLDSYRTVVEKTVRFTVIISTVASCGVLLFASPLISGFLPNFAQSITPLQILTPGFVGLALSSITSSIFIAADRLKQLLIIQSVMLVVTVSMNAVAIALDYGIEGIAVATTLSSLTTAIVVTQQALLISSKNRLESIVQISAAALFVTVAFIVTFALLQTIPAESGEMWITTVRQVTFRIVALISVVGVITGIYWFLAGKLVRSS